MKKARPPIDKRKLKRKLLAKGEPKLREMVQFIVKGLSKGDDPDTVLDRARRTCEEIWVDIRTHSIVREDTPGSADIRKARANWPQRS
jgi:hypothetical protein